MAWDAEANMRIFRQYHDIPAECRGGVVAMGNFDGFHRGHQSVIAEAAKVADLLHVPLGVLTMEPHPRNFFKPSLETFRLTPFRAKAHHMQAFGVDVLTVLHFDAQLAAMTAQDYVLDVLIGGLGISHVVVGYDYRFGRGRGGGVDVLRWMGLMEDFGVTVVAPLGGKAVLESGEKVYSSSRIREQLQAGNPRTAAEAMGHWWVVDGHVGHGDERGRTIGFPTLNLPMTDYLKPRLGVYAVRVVIDEGPHKGIHDGVANIGRRPTFDKMDIILEVHLLDFSGDLYGIHTEVEIVDFIRPEQKFDGLDALKAQIAADCTRARALLASPDNDRDLLKLQPLERDFKPPQT